MSRIGKLPITLPKGVEVKVSEKNMVTVKGKNGELSKSMDSAIKIKVAGEKGYLFETSFETIMFDGFLKAYPTKEEKQIIKQVPTKGSKIDMTKLDFIKSTVLFKISGPH